VRERRLAHGLSQQELAGRAGLSRQALIAIEAGRLVPSVAVALRLARALHCRVDDLFALPDVDHTVEAELGSAAPAPLEPPFRVWLARVGPRLLAWPLAGAASDEQADGIVRERRGEGRLAVELVSDLAEPERSLVLAGCDPALAVLGGHLRRAARAVRALWLPQSSLQALRSLARGDVHLAGTHLWDPTTSEYNLPAVRRELAGRPVAVVTLSRWVEGLLLAPGNPKGIRRLEDLARPGVRIVNRESGSGSRVVFDELLCRAGIEPSALIGYQHEVRGHRALAEVIAGGLADAGPGVWPVARSYGLDFLPLMEERYDLVIPAELLDLPAVRDLLELATSLPFRRELEAGGYDMAGAGTVVARFG
jgi:molybdate-binding protein/DNA-binding XRE family transcriptional regulator